jgi:hypothetical protein
MWSKVWNWLKGFFTKAAPVVEQAAEQALIDKLKS